MKKSLIALAALAATASFAQSSVTISGLIDTAYVDTNNPTGTADTKGLVKDGSATTVLNIAGTEDLGGGLKANFQLQLTPDFINGTGVQSTTAVGNGQQAFVGLSGNFGAIKAGRVNSNALDAWGVGSVFGTAIGSGYSVNGGIYTRYSANATTGAAITASATSQSAPTRFNGAVRYESPVFNGFSGSVLVVPKGADTGVQSVTDIGLKYSNGPLNVLYANQEIKQDGAMSAGGFIPTASGSGLAAGEKSKLNIVAANYTMGAATVYGAYWTEKQAAAVDAKSYMLGAKYVIGATTLMASVGNNNDKLAANADRKIYGIGADYALSKRTALYARYDNRDGNSTSAADDKTKRTAIGVRHTF